jgi:cullin 3
MLDVTILTTVHWPNVSEAPCRLPTAVQPAADAFKDWYLGSHSGRRLDWATSQGTADVSVHYTSRKYELVVSTYQACLLELFNDSATVTFGRMLSETGIPEDQLKRHLISLCTPVARVLIKGKKGKVIAPEDTFTVNAKYKSPKIRNKIKLVTLRSALGSTAATGAVPEQVEMARRNMIDAAVVRIMKARRTLTHQELVTETVHVLSHRFTPTPASIKARIENLIDRDYIARDEADRKRYEYVA